MHEVFVDTSGWASLFDRRQHFNKLAIDTIYQVTRGGRHGLTTNLVLVELTALLNSPLRISKSRQMNIVSTIQSARWIRVVSVDDAIESQAWTLWHSRPDKVWNMVDCSSFVLMQQLGLTEALTADHHFEQAGFARLLK